MKIYYFVQWLYEERNVHKPEKTAESNWVQFSNSKKQDCLVIELQKGTRIRNTTFITNITSNISI